MDRRFLATLALRIAGIYALLQALFPLSFAIDALMARARGEPVRDTVVAVVSPLLFFAVAFVLLRWAPAFAARIVPANEDSAVETEVPSPRAIETIGYRLLGVYAIVVFAPQLLGDLVSPFTYEEPFDGSFLRILLRLVVGSGVGTAIGLYLLFGARGLAELVDRVRGAGLPESKRVWKSKEP